MVENLLGQVSEDRIREHIRVLEGVRHRTAAPEALEKAAAYIQASFESSGYAVQPHVFPCDGREYRNLIATRRGVRNPAQRLLVIAHYDTVKNSPGADDNASAVAALLELARVLRPVEFAKSVQFVAVNLEERQFEGQLKLEKVGLVGSRALAARARRHRWQIEGVIVLEMLAFAGKDIVQKAPEGLPIKLPEFGDFIGVIGNEASRGLVAAFPQAIRRYQIALPLIPLVVPGNGEMLRDTRRSDHAPFWDRGYKAVMVTDTANMRSPHYHQPTDTLDTLNIPFAAQVCRVVAAVIVDLAG